MTLIVGIKCSDGIVVGADGAATLGAMGQQTVRQATKKLDIIGKSVIVGVSGPVGLGQRIRGEVETLWDAKKLSNKKPYEAMNELRQVMVRHVMSELEVAQLAMKVIGHVGAQDAICATVVAVTVGGVPCLFQFSQNCSPEQATDNLPFVAVGSGQAIADPFLAFLRRIFWKDKAPSLQEGCFAALWTLDHAIQINAGGISEPKQLMVLENTEKNWEALEVPEQE